MKTYTPKQLPAQERKWYVVDAQGMTLGRLASLIAPVISGKNKVDFAPHLDNGDYVIVLNCDKFLVTGNKLAAKLYHRHTGFMGGLVSTPLQKLLQKKPTKALEFAVSGMLPKNKLRQEMIQRLKLFTGVEHTYNAQKPESLTF